MSVSEKLTLPSLNLGFQKDFARTLPEKAKMEQATKHGIWLAMSYLRDEIVARTPVKTRHLITQWSGVRVSAGLSFQISNPTHYAITIEEGLYPRVGPRTVAWGGGIWSSQAVGGMVKPVVEDEAKMEHATEIAIKEILRVL